MKDLNILLNKVINSKHYRVNSWDYCHEVFKKARKNKKKYNIDFLCLNLAAYLASYGMYRGSSFILQYDYKIHNGAIKIILKKKYDILQDIKFSDVGKNIDVIFNLANELKKYYKTFKLNKKEITDVLITKIMMGTLGCVPAYDTYMKKTLKKYKIPNTFNKKSLLAIVKLFEDIRIKQSLKKINNKKYTHMRAIDLIFWCESNNNIKKNLSDEILVCTYK